MPNIMPAKAQIARIERAIILGAEGAEHAMHLGAIGPARRDRPRLPLVTAVGDARGHAAGVARPRLGLRAAVSTRHVGGHHHRLPRFEGATDRAPAETRQRVEQTVTAPVPK